MALDSALQPGNLLAIESVKGAQILAGEAHTVVENLADALADAQAFLCPLQLTERQLLPQPPLLPFLTGACASLHALVAYLPSLIDGLLQDCDVEQRPQ